jgi:hypothetical protein
MSVKVFTSERSRAAIAGAWDAALKLEIFGYAELADAAGISLDLATFAARGWAQEGRITTRSGGRGNQRRIYGIAPGWVPETGTGRRTPALNLWTAMRRLRVFTPTDLAAHADTEEAPVSVDHARTYCRDLVAAGYLAVARKAVPGQCEAQYRLARNTGPRAPVVKRVLSLLDPNLRQVQAMPGVVTWP